MKTLLRVASGWRALFDTLFHPNEIKIVAGVTSQAESAGAIQLPTSTENKLIDKYTKPPLVTHVSLGDIPANTALFVNYVIKFNDQSENSGTIHGTPERIADQINRHNNFHKGCIISFEAKLACEPIVGDPRYPKGAIVYEYKSNLEYKPNPVYPVVDLTPEQLSSIYYDSGSVFKIVKVASSGERDITAFNYKLLGDTIRQARRIAEKQESPCIQVIVETRLPGIKSHAIVWDSRNKRPVST
mgnify:CR=1 FL=1